MEQTLFICKEVSLYRLPPRGQAQGWRSGEWRVDDQIFTARCRVVGVGENMEVRLEDPSNGELFGLCPIPPGQRLIAVEPASDSSRNFVLRIEDPVTKRHAFIGMSFQERGDAFEFNVALTDFEKQQRREKELAQVSTSANPVNTAQSLIPEAAALYRHEDLSLKQGESIKIEVKKKTTAEGGGGFLSRLGGVSSTATSTTLLAPPPPAVLAKPPPTTNQPDLLAAFGEFQHQEQQTPAAAQPSTNQTDPQVVASTEEGWATF